MKKVVNSLKCMMSIMFLISMALFIMSAIEDKFMPFLVGIVFFMFAIMSNKACDKAKEDIKKIGEGV